MHARSVTLLETQGIASVEQYLSLGDTASEVRSALATLLNWPSTEAGNIPKLTNGVVPRRKRATYGSHGLHRLDQRLLTSDATQRPLCRGARFDPSDRYTRLFKTPPR